MPFFNCETTLEPAVKSILLQSIKDFELLLINDGSHDRSSAIARSLAETDHRIHYIDDDENIGLVARLNQGIELAKGELVARMDGDDISYPNRFAVQCAYLREHPEVLAVSAAHKRIDHQDVIIDQHRPEIERRANADEVPARESYLPHFLLMVRTRCLRQIGG
jgi:glycosyltransferase involved in cell wall biosynthesis